MLLNRHSLGPQTWPVGLFLFPHSPLDRDSFVGSVCAEAAFLHYFIPSLSLFLCCFIHPGFLHSLVQVLSPPFFSFVPLFLPPYLLCVWEAFQMILIQKQTATAMAAVCSNPSSRGFVIRHKHGCYVVE